jgi:hypothetical protein
MGDAVKATMMVRWCKFGATDIVVETEADM